MKGSTRPLSPWLLLLACAGFCFCIGWAAANKTTLGKVTPFQVGVVLDLGTWDGNISWSCMLMAVDDFYEEHSNYSTRLTLHVEDSKEDVISAASAAVDLLTKKHVEAIVGPQTSIQAKFVAELGNRSQTPIISFSATSPFLSSARTPYFIRTALSDSSQAKAIAALVRSFGWQQLIPIFEDTDYGTGMIPFLIDAFQTTDARVPYRSMIPSSANDDQILRELFSLKTMENRVFVVHASESLAARLFLKAREADMMKEGYAWVVTYGLTDHFSFMDNSTIQAMHGVLTVKPYVSDSDRRGDLDARWWKNFSAHNPTANPIQPSVYALWAYDTAWALALAAETVGAATPPSSSPDSTSLDGLPTWPNGHRLLESILGMDFDGVTGKFHLVKGQLEEMAFEIINVVGGMRKTIGYWTSEHGISGKLDSKGNILGIVWPGDNMGVPKGLEWETSGKKLRIGVPVKRGFSEFVNKEWNPLTNRNGSGFCIEVFDTVMASLPYTVPYEYVPFEDRSGRMNGSYNDLVYQVYQGNYDAVVGDVTITPNRSLYVDFTVPYTELGMSMVVPVKDDCGKSAWIFLRPLTAELWLATATFFIFTGFVVWALEHRINDGFRGPPLHQLGTIFYFAFSTLVFAHREKVMSNLTRVVVIIWVFVVLILTSSYTASLTSMLTVQQLHPTVTNLHDLIRNGEYIGYMGDPSMLGLLNIDKSKLKRYDSPEEYDEALSKGSSRGGVGAIIDEIPYIKVFLSKYCGKYAMVGNIYRTDGFGFVFPKGSPLVSDISRAILKVTEETEKKLYRNKTSCPDQSGSLTSDSLTFDSFWGLFLITGTTSTLALLTYLVFFLYENRHSLSTTDSRSSIWQRLAVIIELYDQKDHSSRVSSKKDIKVAPTEEGKDDKGWHYDNGSPESPSSFSASKCAGTGAAEQETGKSFSMCA